jgi:hypothetical protein
MGGERKIFPGVVNNFVDGRDELSASHGWLKSGDQQPVVAASLTPCDGAGCVSADAVGDEPFARFGCGKVAANLAAKLYFRLL